MASQNRDPAVASVAPVRKGAEPCRCAARGSVGKPLQQELMILMTSGDKGISAFPESDKPVQMGGDHPRSSRHYI
jgi:ubiquitin-conjugating enzyme E2 C